MTVVVAEHRVNRHRLLLVECILRRIGECQASDNVAMQVHASLTHTYYQQHASVIPVHF